MINNFQKLIYKLSCIAPVCVILAITLYTQKLNIFFCIILGLVGIGSCIYAVIFIRLCEKNLPVLKITINNISQDDSSVFVYFATYLIPLVGVVLQDNALVWLLIAAGVIILGIRMNNLGFCPVLLLAGFHCYKASLSTGTECTLISRKKGVRSSKQIGQVERFTQMQELSLDNAQLFIGQADSRVRKKIASIMDSKVLERFSAREIQRIGRQTGVNVAIRDKKIVIPADKKQMKIILGFLDEEVYKGSFSNATYITNSKRSVS